jgi:hypothetical protein
VTSDESNNLVLQDLIDNAPEKITSASQPGFGRRMPTKKIRRPLLGDEYEEVAENYWANRNREREDQYIYGLIERLGQVGADEHIEELKDELGNDWFIQLCGDYRENFVKAAMDWAVWAFLFYEEDHGKGRTHEIRKDSGENLQNTLYVSADRMRMDPKSKIDMRPICWWDVQRHYHDVERKDIDRLAERMHADLLMEAIERLHANNTIRLEHGFWNLKSDKSRRYILLLKRPGKLRASKLV